MNNESQKVNDLSDQLSASAAHNKQLLHLVEQYHHKIGEIFFKYTHYLNANNLDEEVLISIIYVTHGPRRIPCR